MAQENVLTRYSRYRKTERLQLRMATMHFSSRKPVPLEVLEPGFAVHDPTETFADEMTLVESNRRVQLIWAPSETDDTLAVWLPDDGLSLGGPSSWFRDPDHWDAIGHAALHDPVGRHARMAQRTRPLTEFGPLVEGDDINEQLTSSAEA